MEVSFDLLPEEFLLGGLNRKWMLSRNDVGEAAPAASQSGTTQSCFSLAPPSGQTLHVYTVRTDASYL